MATTKRVHACFLLACLLIAACDAIGSEEELNPDGLGEPPPATAGAGATPSPDGETPFTPALDGAMPPDSTLVDAGSLADAASSLDASSGDGAVEDEQCPAARSDLPEVLVLGGDRTFSLLSFSHPKLVARRVVVHLPLGYDENRSYPVVYLHDGILFGVDVAAEVARIVDELIAQGQPIEPQIIVGIESTLDRSNELAPVSDVVAGIEGRGEYYADLVVNTIKPVVDKTFSTRCGRSSTTVAGYSLGGLMCWYMLMRDPDVFGRGLCSSASLWLGGNSQVEAFRAFEGPLPVRVFMDVGTAESPNGREESLRLMTMPAREMRDLAMAKGMELGKSLFYWEETGAAHDAMTGLARLRHTLPYALSNVVLEDDKAEALGLYVFPDGLEESIGVGEKTQVAVERTYAGGARLTWPNQLVTFAIGDSEVATVAQDGLIVGVSQGTTQVDALLNASKAVAPIMVK